MVTQYRIYAVKQQIHNCLKRAEHLMFFNLVNALINTEIATTIVSAVHKNIVTMRIYIGEM